MGSSLALGEEKTHLHCFAPKFFYRYHDETGYKYSTQGFGLAYKLWRPKGINLEISIISTPSSEKVLMETEESIFYKIPLISNFTFFPVFSGRAASHHMRETKTGDYFIHKSTILGGMGCEYIISDEFQFTCWLQGFQDLRNSLVLKENNFFYGKQYTNPFGGRFKANWRTSWERKFVEIEGYVAKTFCSCYFEYGFEMAFYWGF